MATCRPDSIVGAEELRVKGNRVLVEDGQMMGPTSEFVRTANRRLGYHGGLTTQECIAPLAVLAPELMEIEDWEVRPATPPDWWFDGASARAVERAKPKKAGGVKEARKSDLPFFETQPGQNDWIDELLASEVFAEQMETFAGRMKKDQVSSV